jgi:hypothetical protein
MNESTSFTAGRYAFRKALRRRSAWPQDTLFLSEARSTTHEIAIPGLSARAAGP